MSSSEDASSNSDEEQKKGSKSDLTLDFFFCQPLFILLLDPTPVARKMKIKPIDSDEESSSSDSESMRETFNIPVIPEHFTPDPTGK